MVSLTMVQRVPGSILSHVSLTKKKKKKNVSITTALIASDHGGRWSGVDEIDPDQGNDYNIVMCLAV